MGCTFRPSSSVQPALNLANGRTQGYRWVTQSYNENEAKMSKTFTVERSATIPATADQVYSLVVDFHEWKKWSPWDELDPDMNRNYSGEESGPGAKYAWNGNKKVGEGKMAITAVAENERIDIDLSFVKPFKAENKTVFRFAESNGETEMTWSMTGTKNFMMRIMSLFMNMDKMIGKDFEKGLANIANAVKN